MTHLTKTIKDWKCRWFGHKWELVYVGKKNEWKFIGAYCLRWRCFRGHNELIGFLKKTPHDFATHHKEYFE